MSTTPPSPSWLWSCPENDPALASLLDVLVEGGHLRRGGKSDPEICFESSAVAGEEPLETGAFGTEPTADGRSFYYTAGTELYHLQPPDFWGERE